MFIYITAILIVLLCVWCYKKYSFWSSQNVKGLTPFPLLGTIPYFFFKDSRVIDYELYQKYGRVFGEYMGTIPNLVIADPYLAKQVMVSDFHIFNQTQKQLFESKILGSAMTNLHGHEWKRVRSAVSPTFTTNKLRRTLIHLNKPFQNFTDNLDQLIATNSEDKIQIKELTKGYALDAIAKFVFAIEVNSYKQKDHIFVKNVLELVNFRFWPFFAVQILPKFMANKIGDRILNLQACDYFLKLTNEILKQRRDNPDIKYKDFVELLLESSNELSDKEITSQCLLFFFAGLETISSGLSILLSDIAIHQDAQEKMYQEIQKKVGNNEITYESLHSLDYLDAFLHESLRMTPVAPRLIRHSQVEYKLGDTGLTLKAGQQIMINVNAIHRNPDLYTDPFVFRPERYLPEYKDEPYNRFWFAFGDGPRNCVAIRFAMVEIKYLLANLIRNYHIKMAKGCPVPVEYERKMFLTKAIDLRMNFTRRS